MACPSFPFFLLVEVATTAPTPKKAPYGSHRKQTEEMKIIRKRNNS
jgi:hypothetical protein